MGRFRGNIFDVDFNDLNAVKAVADTLGRGQTVYKHPDRTNYNITHSERTDLYKPEWVVYQT